MLNKNCKKQYDKDICKKESERLVTAICRESSLTNKKKTHNPIQKWAKEISQAIHRKKIWMASKYIKWCPIVTVNIQ